MSGFIGDFELLFPDGEGFRFDKLMHILLSGSLNKMPHFWRSLRY